MRTTLGPALRTPDSPDPPRASRARSLLPIVVGVLIAVIATTVYRQVSDPFLAHDDWESFLPKGIPHGADVFRRNLHEGRWLNYLWWLTLGQHGHPVLASALFQLPYLVFIVALARRVTRGWLLALAIPALFVSPMVILLASWPATLGPSMLVLAAAVLALPLVRGRSWALMLWLSAVAVLGVLTYPPVAALAFLAVAIDQSRRRPRALAALGAWFGLSYAVAVLLSFSLNWLEFGEFGFQIAGWRKPNRLRGEGSLAENLSRYAGQWHVTWGVLWLPLVIGLVSVVICLLDRSARRRMRVLLLAGLLVAGLEASTTVLAGVTTPFRGSPWLWVVIVVPIVWCAQRGSAGVLTRGRVFAWTRLFGVIGLAVVVIWGCLYWSQNVSAHQAMQHQYNVIGDRITALQQGHPPLAVVFAERPDQREESRFFVETRSLEMSLYVRDGITSSRCGPSRCDRIWRQGIPAHPRQPVFLFDQRIIVVPPAYID